MIVAFQGERGAYSEAAAREHLGTQIETLPCKTFEEVFAAVEEGSATHGLLPIENSLAGSIHRNYDLMLRYDFQIISEHHYRVQHCLIGLPETTLEDIQSVHSHPQALAQCEASLGRLQLASVVEFDTAGSARLIKEWGDPQAAALASDLAAEVHGLKILARNMEDNPENYTRFLLLTKQPITVPMEEAIGYKTSVVFSLKNQPGSLFKALSVFALREIDLKKIESRPFSGKPWEYLF